MYTSQQEGFPLYTGDTSSLFGTTELPSLETTPSTVPSSSSSSSTTASHDEPVVDLTSDSGMEEEEEEDSDGHIDLTVPRVITIIAAVFVVI